MAKKKPKKKPKKLFVPSLDDMLKQPVPKKKKEEIHENHIFEILQAKQMSQAELCDLSGVSPAHMSKIISGKRKCISLPIAMKISKALREPVETVFEIKDDGK